MLLDKDSCELIEYLLKLKAPRTVMLISKDTRQSRRKIYYHLKKINQALEDDTDKIENLPRVGILLTEQQKKRCSELLENVDFYSYVMSSNERMQLMILYICIARERVTIDKLMELTEVSRNTVLNDLNDIRYQLSFEQYQVNLHSTKALGYYLACHPLNKIQYIYALLYKIFNDGNEAFVSILTEKIKLTMSDDVLLSNQLYAFLLQQVSLVERDLGKKINSYEISFMLNMLPYLLLSCRNMQLNNQNSQQVFHEISLIHNRIEYKVAQQLSQRINTQFHFELSELEIALLSVLLLSYRKDKDSHAISQDYAQMRDVLTQFICHFESISTYVIEQKDDLLRNLLTHCKALLFRKSYGVLTRNPLSQTIKDKYAELYTITKACVPILENAWLIELTDEEVAYLTIHMGGLVKNTKVQQQLSKHIYLICDEGVSVSRLLFKQCSHYLSNNQLEAVFTTEQFRSVEDVIQADLLITTNPDLETTIPVLTVNPILENNDIFKIRYFMKHGHCQSLQFSKELTHILSHYIKDNVQVEEVKERIQTLISSEL